MSSSVLEQLRSAHEESGCGVVKVVESQLVGACGLVDVVLGWLVGGWWLDLSHRHAATLTSRCKNSLS